MIPRPRTVVLWFLGFLAWAAVALWVVSTNSMLDSGDGRAHPSAVQRPGDLHPPRAAASAKRAGDGLLHGLWGFVKPPLAIAALGGIAFAAVRLVGRRGDDRVRLALLPHRDETLDRRTVEELLSACHELLRETPVRAALLGPPTLGLEVATAPGADGSATAALAFVCPEHLVAALEGAVQERCPHTRLVPEPSAPAALPPVTLRLRRPRRTGRSDGDHLGTLLDTMVATQGAARVQYALAASRRPAGRGRALADVAWLDAAGDGAFEPTRPAPVAAAGGPVRPLPMAFHVEVRVAAQTRAACGAIAAAAAAGAGLMPAGFVALRGGLAAPLPRRPRATTTSTELAGAWHLPGAGDAGPRIARTSVPRLPAPARMSRAAEDALVRDERGPVGLDDGDRRGGFGVFGGSVAARRALVGGWLAPRADPDDAVPLVVVTAAPGGAEAVRAALEPVRDVLVMDLEGGRFDALAGPAEPDALGAAVAGALLGSDAAQDGRRVLSLTVAAAIAACRAGALEGPPVPTAARRLLDPAEDELRDGLARELYRRRGTADVGSFVGHELRVHLDDGAGAAARSALDGRRAEILGAAGAQRLSLADVLRRRGVLVLDLAGPGIEDADRGPLARLALAGLGPALREAAPPGRSATVRAALLIDGADGVVDGTLAEELRALFDAGLDVAATWRYGAAFADPARRAVALRLHAHRCLLGIDPAADDLAAATALCDDVVAGEGRLTAQGALTLPNGYALCSWAARGGTRATFVGRALVAS